MAYEITGSNPAQLPKSVNSAPRQAVKPEVAGSGEADKVQNSTLSLVASPQQETRGQEPEVEDIREAVKQVNDYVQNIQRSLNFSIDETSGKTVVKVIDTDSNELIRQIPSEEVLALATHFKEMGETTSGGILFNSEV